ncbi:MAG: MmcQ/YjbR family DNA-binding protein [Alphaproteobacteria bacterium]|nr:MmcQ/YjbR family DNA-binding protein [Alphaproteobacteria bacterium]
MRLEDKIFRQAEADFAKLAKYGFRKTREGFYFEKLLFNDSFKAVIKVSESGIITGEVYDVDTGDIYFPLRVEDMAAGFAGEVRAEYENLLTDIKNKCCLVSYFSSAQANRIADLIFAAYGDKPDFPWEKSADCGVFRNQQNRKWYALIMSIDFGKLEKGKEGLLEIMNIKIAEDKIPELHKQKGIYPAYHMNKKNWITLVLNDTLADEKVMSLLSESHGFTLRGSRK